MKRQIKYPSEKTLQKRVGYTELIPKARYNGIVCPKCGCREFSLYRIKVNTVAYCTKCLSYIKFVSKEDLEKIVSAYTGVKTSNYGKKRGLKPAFLLQKWGWR